jgi:ribonuclease HI
MKNQYYIFTDGGARGNPGPAATGFLVKNSSGKILVQLGKLIGETTNNVAEYVAVIEALTWIKEHKEVLNSKLSTFNFYLDSQLVVNQLIGFYKIKQEKLRHLIIKVKSLEQEVDGRVFYNLISRDKNKIADSLVNQTLGEKNKKDYKLFT